MSTLVSLPFFPIASAIAHIELAVEEEFPMFGVKADVAGGRT